MPRKPIDYSNTHFYKIVCKDTTITDCYVGHTTDFKSRKSRHRQSCTNESSKEYYIHVYKFMRDNGGFDNFDMLLIETQCLTNSLEAKREERKHIEQLNASLNSYMPSRTNKEWREANQDILRFKQHVYNEENRNTLAIKHKTWSEQNKVILATKHKQYRELNREVINEKKREQYERNKAQAIERQKEYSELNKDKIKEWRNNNREMLNIKHKEYVDQHRDRINARRRELNRLRKDELSSQI
jgi:hypothetical protein